MFDEYSYCNLNALALYSGMQVMLTFSLCSCLPVRPGTGRAPQPYGLANNNDQDVSKLS